MYRYLSTGTFWLLGLILSVSGWGQVSVNVLTQHNDNARTGDNLSEMDLNTSNVRPGQFGKLFSRAVDGQIYAQPLYVSNLPMPDGKTHNVVYVATQHNSVYAFDADDPDQSDPLWKVNLGPSVVTPNSECCNRYGPYHDLFPELGITGTPVIDDPPNTLYVVAFTKELGVYHQRLHALDITTGANKFGGPVEISGSVPGTGDGSVDGVVAFNPLQHMQRPGLLLSNGVVYVAFASHADTDPYHGWVFAYDALTLSQLGIFCTTPNDGEGGIWQSNNGLVADADGDVYFMTGNKRIVNPEVFPGNYGESFVKLRLEGDNGLTVVDWFTPCNQCYRDNADADLGSAGPLLIPGMGLLLGGGKLGTAYLLDQNNLGQFNSPHNCSNTCTDDQIVQRFQVFNGALFGSPIYWNSLNGPLVYFWGNGDVLKAYKMRDDRTFNPTPDSMGSVSNPHGGGGLSLSANGSTPGTGIVWGTRPLAGSNPITQMGELHAFDASNLANHLWSSNGPGPNDAAFDGLGTLAKFNVPTIANGRVYTASASGQLHVYGLLPKNPLPLVRITAPTTRSTIIGPADITVMATALTRDGSPGTIVDFYADDTLIGTAPEEPYSFVWEKAPLGLHTLYAIATAPNEATARSSSVEIDVVSEAPPIGSFISIKLRGASTTPMGLDEVAGVPDLDLARSNWNDAISEDSTHSRKEGWLNTLVDDTGMETGARMSWTANSFGLLFIPNIPGDFRMMRGYLDTSNTTSTNVTVYDLPASFTTNGYDVYVYFDGDNLGESRTANFRIGPTLVSGTDAANVDFSGTFIQAIAGSAGNYVVIPGLTEDRFNLEAIPDTTPIGTRRAPVNSIQIVAHGAMQ